ncbi:putative glycolate oxidase iron-sulfur subunit [Paenibacillus cisolokensis]|uniref:Glycolate oxidase iron-sulfur subunit n=1 Tax=Paenibacillus cisolokensis TaxID=1658519 RepID=A0ABQ4NED0_9BACL|nr:putative glycolate oxidase iron-sulfur subunit [Paenibacillus cisolokensis]
MVKTLERQEAATDGAPRLTKLSPLAASLKLKLDEDQLTNCMRCGFCLPACPTFRETGVEAESPRGRIALMKAAAEGLLAPDAAFEQQMYHCLGCRACEPACPADVKYGQLIEQAREAIEEHTTSRRWWVKAVRTAVFKGLFPKQNRMRMLGGALRLYQRSGLARLARGAGVLKLLPKHLAEMEAIMPEASGRGVVERIGERHAAKGERIATVGLFRGCIMDMLFTDTNVKTVELLTEAGFDVVIPPSQNCCGALHAHSGEVEDAKALARRNIEAFRAAGVDYIVSNAGGCGAILSEYDHLLHHDESWKEGGAWFAKRVIDISDLLVRYGRMPSLAHAASAGAAPEGGPSSAGSRPVRITYQDSCHLRNVMRAGDSPRRLMRSIAGVEFVEMPEADRCCGSAGIYNLTQPEMAGQILEKKMACVGTTGADVVLTSNPGCLLQMKLGEARHGAGREVLHIVDFVHGCMRADGAKARE